LTSGATAWKGLALICLPALTGCEATQPAADEPAAEVVQVKYVTDGDTLRLADGRDVRLIGIDTPERDACGYEQARSLLNRLVVGSKVTITITPAPGQDVDRYDRLLRYVEADGADVAEALLDRGWAEARYDSQDGYPEHPRQDDYRAADAGSVNRGC
jgi:endonuclease YncB( thermonuclease family)